MEKLVNAVPGVKSSQASWLDNRLVVVVAADATLDDAAIHDAIKRANFTLAEPTP